MEANQKTLSIESSAFEQTTELMKDCIFDIA